MSLSEETSLLESTKPQVTNKLSLTFAIICIVDVFGVFPVVTLPKAVIDCGFYGVLVVVLVCTIQIYTAILLGKCWIIAEKIDLTVREKNRYPYAALAEITYGSAFSNFVSFVLNLTIFFGGIPNLIVASQNLQLLGLRISDNTFNVSFCFWIVAIGAVLCPVLWLGSPKDMKLLCSISVGLVILVFCLVFGCLLFTSNEASQIETLNEIPLWELIFMSYGIISFQYDIHPSVLTIQVDMQEKFKLNLALVGAFAISLGMFTFVTISSAIKFGVSTKPSLLETLPTSIPLHFAAFFVALQLCLTLAVSNSALFQHMEDCMSIPRVFNQRRCILRTTLTLLAILIAESVPRFDLVMSLIGGTLTGPLMFILPPLFYLKMLKMEKRFVQQVAMDTFTVTVYQTDEEANDLSNFCIYLLEKSRGLIRTRIDVALCLLIILCSSFLTVATTYVNMKNTIVFANFEQPCILNVSTAIMNL